MKNRKVVGTLVGAAMVMSLFGQTAGAEESKPYAGETLRVAVEDGGQYAIWYDSIKGEFEELTGATVELIGASNEAVVAECMNGSGYYDVITMDGPLIPQYASMGWLLPLDDRISPEDLEDFWPSAIDSVSYEGQIYCLPYLVHGPVIYYRTDLFEAAGLDHAPATVEEYREFAQKLNDPDNGVYGTIIEGKQSAEPVSQLMDKIYQFGGELISTEDPTQINFNTQEVIDTFQYIVDMYGDGSMPEGSSGYDNGDVQNMFLEGQVAMVCNWPYMWSMVNDEQYSKVTGKVAVAPQPEANAVWSWSFGISPDSHNLDLAYEWCRWSTSSDVVARLGEYFINPVPRSSSVETASAAITEEDDRQAFVSMSASLEQGVAPVLSTNFEELRLRVALTLNRIATGETTDIAGEVAECAADLQDILDEAE